ncbi:MAG: ATP-binding protein, partial [Proteobacteria bacterium]|nr:ATP-binding protein [Pseudomonadota bacterium]
MAHFRTRARAVDMLGRQQIAGIPTAISELFKNAHDAYADRVEVDYFRGDRLFTLRDDGVGMTLEEFEGRWLTLGTDSKVGGKSRLARPPKDPDKPERAILGEKGIGRLAIASIGPQVLVLTRARREGRLLDLVAAYIHWGIFELPGVDLDEIEIPIRTFAGGTLPSRDELAEMVGSFAANLDNLADRLDPDASRRLRTDFDRMRFDPGEVDGYVPDLSLASDGHGTHFVIAPANELLEADLDEGGPERASKLEKLLLGFTNTMTPSHSAPVIRTAFREHGAPGVYDDLVDESRFFTPDEFKNADHHIGGRFDEFGQFEGTVSVYGEANEAYRIPWSKAQGRETSCGPFSVNVAVVQGQEKATTIPLEDHAVLTQKLNRLGGLYIYRDGIRVLPYGDTDYDWLSIEKRRTYSASYYYFSYRRIFGAVELSRQGNPALSEKAGREGFRETALIENCGAFWRISLYRWRGTFSVSRGPIPIDSSRRRPNLTVSPGRETSEESRSLSRRRDSQPTSKGSSQESTKGFPKRRRSPSRSKLTVICGQRWRLTTRVRLPKGSF